MHPMSEPAPYGRRKYDKSVNKGGYRTKRVALPGGKIIEVVYFSEPEGDETAHDRPPVPEVRVDATDPLALLDMDEESDLDICPQCESELVFPLSWEERPDYLWRITRRCPTCEWTHTGEFTQDEVELYDVALNEGTEELLVTLRNFARANMEDDVELLIALIRDDRIQPMDF
jgi:hypothetical protein